jgi:outer membrane lipoprotein-sorting protein
MKQKQSLVVLLLLALTGPLFAADVNGDAILRAVDQLRNFDTVDFTAVMSLIREDEDGVEKMTVQQFRRDGEDKFVMLFLEPAVQKGQGYLRIDDNLWFYDPESRKFSHTSMKEQFGGTDARNSDFGLSKLVEDYQVADLEAGTLGRYEVYILDLEARHNEVTYPRQKIWVTRDPYLVLKTEDYSETGRLLRTSLYPNYAKAGDKYVPSRLIFIDELVDGKKTSITLSEISLADVPDTVFSKTYIERVNR